MSAAGGDWRRELKLEDLDKCFGLRYEADSLFPKGVPKEGRTSLASAEIQRREAPLH